MNSLERRRESIGQEALAVDRLIDTAQEIKDNKDKGLYKESDVEAFVGMILGPLEATAKEKLDQELLEEFLKYFPGGFGPDNAKLNVVAVLEIFPDMKEVISDECLEFIRDTVRQNIKVSKRNTPFPWFALLPMVYGFASTNDNRKGKVRDQFISEFIKDQGLLVPSAEEPRFRKKISDCRMFDLLVKAGFAESTSSGHLYKFTGYRH